MLLQTACLCLPTFYMLNPNLHFDGFRRWSLESELIGMGSGGSRELPVLFCHMRLAKRQLSVNKKSNPDQTPNLPVFCLWTPQPLEL